MRRICWFSFHGLATILLIGAALYFLLVEHGEHVYPALPYLVLLVCPLMHLFMHKSHGGGQQHHHQEASNEAYRRGLEEGRRSKVESQT